MSTKAVIPFHYVGVEWGCEDCPFDGIAGDESASCYLGARKFDGRGNYRNYRTNWRAPDCPLKKGPHLIYLMEKNPKRKKMPEGV